MTQPIDDEFCNVILAAVRAVREFVLDPERDLGHVSRRAVPKFRTNEHGWPSVASSFLRSGGAADPMDWSSLFGHTVGRGSAKFAISEVQELQDVADYVRDHPLLAEKVSPTSTRAEDDERAAVLRTNDVIALVATIIERSIATGEAEHEVYLQHERALLADTLIADVLAPIALVMLDLEESVELGQDVWIEPLDEATHRARAVDTFGSENPYFVSAATHAVVLRAREFDNSRGSVFRQISLELQPRYVEQIEQVFQALTIASEQPTGYAQLLLRPRDWADRWVGDLPAIQSVGTMHRYPTSLGDRGWNKEPLHISHDRLEALPATYQALTKSSRRGQLAARRLFGSALRTDVEDVILDACIGVEALLVEEPGELVHRMGLRAAVALAPHGWGAERAHEVLKKVYSHRSKIVHGTERKDSTIKLGEIDYSTDEVAVFLLGRLLQSHLAESPAWTPKTLDQRLFDSVDASLAVGADSTNSEQ